MEKPKKWFHFRFYLQNGETYEVMHLCEDKTFAKCYASFEVMVNNYAGAEVRPVCDFDLRFSEVVFEIGERGGVNP